MEALAGLDRFDEALERLNVLPAVPERNTAVDRVVATLIGKKELDRAVDLLARSPEATEFPFAAAGRLMSALPDTDGRLATVFGYALEGWRRVPQGPFAVTFARQWKRVPESLATSASLSLVRELMDRKKDDGIEIFATGKGKKLKLTYTQRDLLEVLPGLRTLDPKKAEEVLRRSAELRAALEEFPNGRYSEDEPEDSVMPFGAPDFHEEGANIEVELQRWSASMGRAMEVMEEAGKDPDAALGHVDSIGLDSHRIEALYAIAKKAKQESRGGLLDRCASDLKRIKKPAERVRALVAMAGIANESKMPEGTQRYLSQAFSSLSAVLKADEGNQEIADFRPSTASCRHAAYHAAEMLGLGAESLLGDIGDPELALLARVEMTRALLKLPATNIRQLNVVKDE
ncbi:MAG: hypothetical protein SGI92_03765 [Bryobacteraceae bacterium]|nr:hypothetical protein [Bryobacteraceae bacterium]